MTPSDSNSEREQIEQAITAQESLRGITSSKRPAPPDCVATLDCTDFSGRCITAWLFSCQGAAKVE